MITVLALMLSLNTAVVDSNTAPVKSVISGDPAPSFAACKWLQKGAYGSVQPDGTDEKLITVVIFWNDWCPLARAVLPKYDQMQARLSNRGVRFIAIGEGHPDNIEAIVKQLKLRNLAVARDDEETTLAVYLGSESEAPTPFAVITEENNKLGEPKMLWKGPIVTYDGSFAWDDGYTRRLDDVLPEVIVGRFDVSAAREIEITKVEARQLADQMQDARNKGQIDQTRTLARKVMSRNWPLECRETITWALALSSWAQVNTKEPQREQISDALEMIKAAIKIHGRPQPALSHIYARALFESGNVNEAITAEKEAMNLPFDRNSFGRREFEEALARYEEAATGHKTESLAPEKTAAAESSKTSQAPEKPLTAEEAASDLAALHDNLGLNYVAYDDIAWRLDGEGTSWEKRNAAFLEKIKARTEWQVCDFFDLVTEYLRVVNDRHLYLEGTFSRDQGRQHGTWQSRPTTGVYPFFADMRVREQDGRMVLVKSPEGISIPSGATLVDVPIIGTPFTLQPGKTYLFPTLPLESASAKEYLLGTLAGLSSKPNQVKVPIAAPSGNKQEIDLPLHRGKQDYKSDREHPWSLKLEPIPVLTVQRMWGDGMDGLIETADKLRDLPVVVLDFRTDGGGSDRWATDWVKRFNQQEYLAYRGAAELNRGQTDPLRRWDSFARFSSAGDTSMHGKRFRGKLFIITGVGCASGGETFSDVARQIPGAVLVGENSAGFITYGNIDQSFTCPRSGIKVTFGRSKFVMGKRPMCESIGMFPDYWLDEKDPISAIAAYCALK